MKLGVVSYGMGNTTSVLNAFRAIGEAASLVATPEALLGCDALVLPGVGAFAEAMARLNESGLVAALHAARNRNTPILGVCLGLQLMAEASDEHGYHVGLGWLKGRVQALPAPHVGWNALDIQRDTPLLTGIRSGECFYFVHGYAFVGEAVCATANHHGARAAVISDGRLVATQFHPEKSQDAGLQVLRNFLALAC